MSQKMSLLLVLKTYFALPGQSVSEFASELKQLTAEEKLELAVMAADAMGIPADERGFGESPESAAA